MMPDTLTQVLSLLEKSPDVNAQAARQMLVEANLVELPCEIGDTVYKIIELNSGEKIIIKGEMSSYMISKDGLEFYFSEKSRCFDIWCHINNFGKTAFLTGSAAREALEGVK
jgi:hypothetical protein